MLSAWLGMLAGGFGGFPGGRDVGLPDMPAGVDVEEARMLEAAMLGIPYTGRMDFAGGGGTNGANCRKSQCTRCSAAQHCSVASADSDVADCLRA